MAEEEKKAIDETAAQESPREAPTPEPAQAAPAQAPEPPTPPPAPPLPEMPTDQDRILAGLAYIIGGIVSAVILFSTDLSRRRFLRYHAVQALGLWAAIVIYEILAIVLCVVLATVPCIGWALSCLVFIATCLPIAAVFYYAYLAYQGKTSDIRYLTDFMVKQGWL